MSNQPSPFRPNTTEAVDVSTIVRGTVAGMENPDTHTLEVVQFGDRTEDGLRIGLHFQTGTQRFEGFVADIADLKVFKLPKALADAGYRYRRNLKRSVARGPVPVCRNASDLAFHNCD